MNIESILSQFPENVFSEEDKNFIREKTKTAYAFNDHLQKKHNCSQQEAEQLLKLYMMTRIESFIQELVDSNESENLVKEKILEKMISLTKDFAIKEGLSETDADVLKNDSLEIINFFGTKGYKIF